MEGIPITDYSKYLWLSAVVFLVVGGACSKDATVLKTGLDPVVVDGGAERDGSTDGSSIDGGPDSGPIDGGHWTVVFFDGYPVGMNAQGTMVFTTGTPAGFNETWVRYADGGIEYVGGKASDGGVKDTFATGIGDDNCVIGLSHLLGDLPGGDPFLWCPGGSLQRLAADAGLTQAYRPVSIDTAHRISGDHQGAPFLWITPDAGQPLPKLGRGSGRAVGFLGAAVVGWLGRDSGYTVAALWPTPDTLTLLWGDDGEDFAAYSSTQDGRIFGACPGPSGGVTACIWPAPDARPTPIAVSTAGASVAATRLAGGRIPYGSESLPSGGYNKAAIWFAGPDGPTSLVESILSTDAGCEFIDVVGANAQATSFVGPAVCNGFGKGYIASWQ